MPTYTYEVTTEGEHFGETVEVSQSIKEPAFTTLTIDGKELSVRRVISGPAGFILKGGAWARDGYTHATQPLTKEDRANLDKPNK